MTWFGFDNAVFLKFSLFVAHFRK